MGLNSPAHFAALLSSAASDRCIGAIAVLKRITAGCKIIAALSAARSTRLFSMFSCLPSALLSTVAHSNLKRNTRGECSHSPTSFAGRYASLVIANRLLKDATSERRLLGLPATSG